MEKVESGYSKPLPMLRPETEQFWKGAKRHEFLLQKCNDCGEVIYPPKVACPKCLLTNMGWFKASGKGEVYSYTIVYQAAEKSFEKDVPYIYAVIELEDGVRVVSNVVNVDLRRIKVGTKVKVMFDDITPDISIPKFEPV